MLSRPLIAGVFATLGSTVCAVAAAQAAPSAARKRRAAADGPTKCSPPTAAMEFAARWGDPKIFANSAFRSLRGHFAADA